MTPFEIKIVLHHHSSYDEFSRADAPAYPNAVMELIKAGVLTQTTERVTTTPLGAALVQMWCDTPLPVKKWVDPRFEERK